MSTLGKRLGSHPNKDTPLWVGGITRDPTTGTYAMRGLSQFALAPNNQLTITAATPSQHRLYVHGKLSTKPTLHCVQRSDGRYLQPDDSNRCAMWHMRKINSIHERQADECPYGLFENDDNEIYVENLMTGKPGDRCCLVAKSNSVAR